MGSNVLKLSEAAQALRIGVKTLKRAIKRGDIEITRIGKRSFITQETIAGYLARNTKLVGQ